MSPYDPVDPEEESNTGEEFEDLIDDQVNGDDESDNDDDSNEEGESE